MIYGIFLIILGLLAIPSLLANKPSAKALLEKIVPFQGWIGVVFFIGGIFGVIQVILAIGWLTTWPIGWVFWLLVELCELFLGFLLGYGLIAQYALSKNEAARAKGEQMLAKLLPWQGRLGIAAIVLGVLYTVLYVIH
jgi:hypothetical protein